MNEIFILIIVVETALLLSCAIAFYNTWQSRKRVYLETRETYLWYIQIYKDVLSSLLGINRFLEDECKRKDEKYWEANETASNLDDELRRTKSDVIRDKHKILT